ncbi:MAG TPA: PIG-L family deacetylase [Actinopolymorphaceae bacterium]
MHGAAKTCVFFHAHPDDEALYTSGTMARLAAEGHRVVLVVATAGDRGLAAEGAYASDLGSARLSELEASARALGVARVEYLGYADSGWGDATPIDGRTAFSKAPIDEAAEQLAAILTTEGADLVTIYDENGGYGHVDHVQVHRVGSRAAELAGTPVVLQATIDRDLLLKGLRLISRFYRMPPEFDMSSVERSYVPRARITHRIDVRRYARAKRASLAAHATQATGGDSIRTVAALLRLPHPLFRLVLGTEWFVQGGLPVGTRLRHPLATLADRTHDERSARPTDDTA